MNIDSHKLLPLISLNTAFFILGCGEASSLAVVTGTVLLNGEPVPNAAIMLRPKLGGRPAWANTDEKGTFTLTTFEKGDGALIGVHSVTVTKFEETENSDQPTKESPIATLVPSEKSSHKKRWLVPERYSKAETSRIEYEVNPGANTLAIDLD